MPNPNFDPRFNTCTTRLQYRNTWRNYIDRLAVLFPNDTKAFHAVWERCADAIDAEAEKLDLPDK